MQSWHLKAAGTLSFIAQQGKHLIHLTCLRFPNYISRMENELIALESKLAQLIQISGQLRRENHQLRQDLAQAQSQNRQCNDKMEGAKARLEKLLSTLPEELS